MRPSFRALVCACALAGALPALYDMASCEHLGLLPTALDLPAARRAYREEKRRQVEGLAERDEVLARAEAKRAVAEALADGRLTLAEAGARIRALNAGDTEFVRRIRLETYGAHTEEEALHVLRLLADERPGCGAVADRLEAGLGRPTAP